MKRDQRRHYRSKRLLLALSASMALAVLASSVVAQSEPQASDVVARLSSHSTAIFDRAIQVRYRVYHHSFLWSSIRDQYEKHGVLPDGWTTDSGETLFGEDWLYKREPGGAEILRFTEVLLPLDPAKHPELITTQTMTVFFNGKESYVLSERPADPGAENRTLSVFPGNYLDSRFAGAFRYPLLVGLGVKPGESSILPFGQTLEQMSVSSMRSEPDGKTWIEGQPSDESHRLGMRLKEVNGRLVLQELAKTYEGTDHRMDISVQSYRRDSSGLPFPEIATYALGPAESPARAATVELVDITPISSDELETAFSLDIPEGTRMGWNEATGNLVSISASKVGRAAAP